MATLTPQPAKSSSLALRAVLAILLTIGFYGLALAIAGGLLFLVYAEVVYLERINLRLPLFCLLGAGTILWAIAPRFDNFVAPGARLKPSKSPRLFAVIQSVATRLNQKMPSEVYLVSDVNAFVAERGGWMGIGSKRVMGIGLPLLQSLSVAQLSSILAHEFGHFYGGDTSLGPWIYKTRNAIMRTISSLGNSIIQVPFRAYGELFMNITQAISRNQELVADRLAAEISGKKTVISSLIAIHGLAPVYNHYWESEVVPVFNGGFRPPLAGGFALFTQTEQVSTAMQVIIANQMNNQQTDKLDSHPSLADRIRSVEALPDGPEDENSQSALGLVDYVDQLEQKLLEVMFGVEKIRPLQPLEWEKVGSMIYLAQWERAVKQFEVPLANFNIASVPTLRANPEKFRPYFAVKPGQVFPSEDLKRGVETILAFAMGLELHKDGWSIETRPGCPITLNRDEWSVNPFEMIQSLGNETISEEEWCKRCAGLGIVV